MCIYCMIADFGRQFLPYPYWSPVIPTTTPIIPNDGSTPVTIPVIHPTTPVHSDPINSGINYPLWTLEQLDAFEDILSKVKEMEDRLGGCPCEDPSKMDYLKKLRMHLEKQKTIGI